MKKHHLKNTTSATLFLLALFFSHSTLAASFRANLALGVGTNDYTLSQDYNFDSVGSTLDIMTSWNKFRAGFIYSVSYYTPLGKPDEKIEGGGLVFGYGGKWAEMVVGYGYAEASRTVQAIPVDDVEFLSGPALFGGVRIHLLHFKAVTIGLSATYTSVSDSEYKDNGASGRTRVTKDVDASSIVYGLNFNFAAEKIK